MLFLFSGSHNARRKAAMDNPEHMLWLDLVDKVRGGLKVRTDSRAVQPGEVFVCMPSAQDKADAFMADAVARGAAYVVCSGRPQSDLRSKAVFLERTDPAADLGELARATFKTDELSLKILGITGTNGKTTTSYLVEHILSSAGLKVGVLGTVSYRWPGFSVGAPLTTPGCWQLHELMANMEKSDVDVVVMEVSSHALDQKRVAGLSFEAAALTNVTQDHLDYHGDMETYFKAKASLFESYLKPGRTAVLNWDDPYGRRLLERLPTTLGYGLGPDQAGSLTLAGQIMSCTGKGLTLRMAYKGKTWDIDSPLVGRHNAQNLLTAQASALALGVSCKEMRRLAAFTGVPGRLERVENDRGLDIFVDYAHTPDALINVQKTLRELDFKRLITVFGCGGDRDRTKRPLMARAVAEYSDVAVLTSDNPRHEEPLAIMADARPGLAAGPRGLEIIETPDRSEAIRRAVAMMRPGDALLVAGKGHETYQQIGDAKIPFSDQETVRAAVTEIYE